MNRGVRAATKLSGCAAPLLDPSRDAITANVTSAAHNVAPTRTSHRLVRRFITPESKTGRTDGMKIRAAVLEEFGRPLEVQEVDLAEPKAGEVLVRLVACGVCHTD